MIRRYLSVQIGQCVVIVHQTACFRFISYCDFEIVIFLTDWFICILCALVLFLHVCLCEGVRSPGTEVTGRCELPCGCFGYWTQVFFKSSQCFQLLSHIFPATHIYIFKGILGLCTCWLISPLSFISQPSDCLLKLMICFNIGMSFFIRWSVYSLLVYKNQGFSCILNEFSWYTIYLLVD